MANRLLQYYQAEYTVDAMLFQNVTDKVQIILDTKLKDRYLEDYIGDFRVALQQLLEALPEFSNLAGTRLVAEKTAKTVYHGNEDLIHSVMNYIVLQVKTISRFATEISVGLGKADIAFIDAKNRCAAIIELKYNQSTDIALEQIADRSYARDIVNSCNTILLGVNVLPDKTVQVKHKIITSFP